MKERDTAVVRSYFVLHHILSIYYQQQQQQQQQQHQLPSIPLPALLLSAGSSSAPSSSSSSWAFVRDQLQSLPVDLRGKVLEILFSSLFLQLADLSNWNSDANSNSNAPNGSNLFIVDTSTLRELLSLMGEFCDSNNSNSNSNSNGEQYSHLQQSIREAHWKLSIIESTRHQVFPLHSSPVSQSIYFVSLTLLLLLL